MLKLILFLSTIALALGEAHAAPPFFSSDYGKYSILLRADGTVLTWGWGNTTYDAPTSHLRCGADYGGDLKISSRTKAAVRLPGKAVAVGSDSTALLSDGTVWTWRNIDYRLENGADLQLPSSPLQVPGLSGIKAISKIGQYAVHQNGTVSRWGWVSSMPYTCQASYSLSVPTSVENVSDVVAVADGHDHVVVLKTDGTVWTAGSNWYGQLGTGEATSVRREQLAQVPGLTGVVAVDASLVTSIALKADGTVWMWGGNGYGQLARTPVEPWYSNVPVQIPGLTDVKAVSAGTYHNVALKSDGTAWGWGGGNIYSGTYAPALCEEGASRCEQYYTTPIKLRQGNNVIAATAGEQSTILVKSDGTAVILGHLINAYFAPLTDGVMQYGLLADESGQGSANALQAPAKSTAERIMDWAEQKYPGYFSPAGSITQTDLGYAFRYFRSSNSYLGTKDGRVWYIAPGDNLAGIKDVGGENERLLEAQRDGY